MHENSIYPSQGVGLFSDRSCAAYKISKKPDGELILRKSTYDRL